MKKHVRLTCVLSFGFTCTQATNTVVSQRLDGIVQKAKGSTSNTSQPAVRKHSSQHSPLRGRQARRIPSRFVALRRRIRAARRFGAHVPRKSPKAPAPPRDDRIERGSHTQAKLQQTLQSARQTTSEDINALSNSLVRSASARGKDWRPGTSTVVVDSKGDFQMLPALVGQAGSEDLSSSATADGAEGFGHHSIRPVNEHARISATGGAIDEHMKPLVRGRTKSRHGASTAVVDSKGDLQILPVDGDIAFGDPIVAAQVLSAEEQTPATVAPNAGLTTALPSAGLTTALPSAGAVPIEPMVSTISPSAIGGGKEATASTKSNGDDKDSSLTVLCVIALICLSTCLCSLLAILAWRLRHPEGLSWRRRATSSASHPTHDSINQQRKSYRSSRGNSKDSQDHGYSINFAPMGTGSGSSALSFTNTKSLLLPSIKGGDARRSARSSRQASQGESGQSDGLFNNEEPRRAPSARGLSSQGFPQSLHASRDLPVASQGIGDKALNAASKSPLASPRSPRSLSVKSNKLSTAF